MPTRTIERQIELPCSPERAFALLLCPSAIRDWWRAARAIVLARPGGTWAAAWGADEDAPDYVTIARLRVCEPPHRLVLDEYRHHSRFGPLPFEAEFEVEFTVEPRPAGCRLRVRQSGFPAAAVADGFFAGCQQGWKDTLSGLLRHVQERHREPIRIESARLRLRELGPADAAFVLELTNEPGFLAHIGDKGLRNLDDARRFLAEGSWTRQALAGHGQLLVESLASGEPLGVCGLLRRAALDQSDVGFAFLERHQRRGYATEAAQAVVRYGTEQLGLQGIVGITSAANSASIRVLEKLGLRLKEYVRLSDGEPPVGLYV